MGLTVLCPSRGRPDAAWALQQSFDQTIQTGSRLVFVVDSDDPTWDAYKAPRDGRHLLMMSPEHAGGMVNALNAAAAKTLADWPHEIALGFVGDDHRFRTPGWDRIFLQALRDRPGFVYGNDLVWQNGEIPTQVFMSASIVSALGWMGLPTCDHLYIDNAWLELGNATGSIRYHPEVIIEHLHPAIGKAQWDEGYIRVNATQMYEHDGAAYGVWRNGQRFLDDVKTVTGAISGR